MTRGPPSEESARPKILHGFADHGTESETLRLFGSVTRFGIDPEPNGIGEVIAADASNPTTLPFREGEFDLGLFHPPCGPWATATNNSATHDDHPQLVEEAREIGERYADHYIIENVPRAPLNDPVVLDGRMFGLPVKYERAFETSFDVAQPPRNERLGQNAETSSYFYSEKPHAWWAAMKGVPAGKYPVEATAKNATPVAYLTHVLQAWIETADEESGAADSRPDYSNYGQRLDTRERREENQTLKQFAASPGGD